jgi:hypothetical protein
VSPRVDARWQLSLQPTVRSSDDAGATRAIASGMRKLGITLATITAYATTAALGAGVLTWLLVAVVG